MPRLETLRAKVGATVLDIFKPGWAGKISLATLDLSDCEVCVLGKLFGDYERGCTTLFGAADNEEARAKAGFCADDALLADSDHSYQTAYTRLTKSWKREIEKRQAA